MSNKKDWAELVTEDFNNMRSMISDIEIKLMGVDYETQRRFYRPILYMIVEAHRDANNSEDSFLFNGTIPKH
jgi:hypothetical protein